MDLKRSKTDLQKMSDKCREERWVKNIPDKVFHYTPICTLEKILKNKTIRFSRFDLMDDKTETQGLPSDMKLNYFLSCWCCEKRESIPQWAMYAPNGVRIELPQKWYNVFREEGWNETFEDHPCKKMFRPFAKFYTFDDPRHFTFPNDEEEGFFVKVEYKDDFLKRKMESISDIPLAGNGRPYYSYGDPPVYIYNLSDPIKYKDTSWKFQNEFRYFLFAARGDKKQLQGDEDSAIYIPVEEDALQQIKIRLYPNCREEDERVVRAFIKEHLPDLNPDNCVKRSEFDGKYVSKKFDKSNSKDE